MPSSQVDSFHAGLYFAVCMGLQINVYLFNKRRKRRKELINPQPFFYVEKKKDKTDLACTCECPCFSFTPMCTDLIKDRSYSVHVQITTIIRWWSALVKGNSKPLDYLLLSGKSLDYLYPIRSNALYWILNRTTILAYCGFKLMIIAVKCFPEYIFFHLMVFSWT